MSSFSQLTNDLKNCRICEPHLPLGPRPVFQLTPSASVLIVGHAPGKKVHETGIPFDDASGKRLREWLGISTELFYDASCIAILPMGLCYPGTGKSGDLPPRPECATTWHQAVLSQLPDLKLKVLLGAYAQAAYCSKEHKTLTERVAAWESYLPECIPLPHPSPRNNIWLKNNPWFVKDVLPTLKKQIDIALS
ncbi:MAG: IclR family transcriptional regulator [Cycloclasticus sp. symbiont of Poecilosclerida sp. M]|nr:MAG: IclR family transcriptional regulator [Cycloclasticus sp. symbiont of Poecilosclerida sp. M]